MRDSVPYLLAKLEQGEASSEDLRALKVLVERQANPMFHGRQIDIDTYKILTKYIAELEEKYER